MDQATPIVAETPSYDGDTTATPSPAKRPVSPIPAAHPAADRNKRRGFAGFTTAQLVIGLVVLAAAIWAMWATSKIIALDHRRVVSVRLASIVNDFVAAEARSGTLPEQLGPQTRAFMTALDGVLKARAARGEVVLVGEAVVASSVPDVTGDIVADLGKVVKLPAAAAMPPAITPIVPQTPQGSPAAQPVAPVSDSGGNPFGSMPTQAPEAEAAQ